MNPSWAVFDFDGTLYAGNSFSKLLQVLYPRQAWRQTPKVVVALCLRKVRRISLKSFQETGLDYFCGWEKDDLEKWGMEFFNSHLLPNIFGEAEKFVCKLKNDHWNLVLATGAPDFYALAVAKHFGFQKCVCTRLEYCNNVYSGQIAGEICLADEKAKELKLMFMQNGIEPELVNGYSDHISDLGFLKIIGFPHAVNPESQLKKYARKNGWPEVYWK